METVKFYTLGCKVNQYDTQNIREQFIGARFKELDNNKPADIYIINTCTVTHRADAKSLSLIRRAKGENPKAKIVVTGCLAELDVGKIRKIDGASLILKNKDKKNILKYLLPLNLRTGELANPRTINGISYFKAHTRAFLKIQDGCNNSCSYCKVPLVRGRSQSKPLDEVIREAENLVRNDFREIVLCGICLGAYGGDLKPPVSLVEVIDKLENIEGILRIRLSSIEANDVSDRLIDKIAGSQKLCPHLHIPIQSGDDDILRKMHRSYKRDDYINLIKRIKKKIPSIAITTDCLVGFPGENEENFLNTVRLIKETLPLKTHIFPYSRRDGTCAASEFKEEISHIVVKERLTRMREVAEECASRYKRRFLNTDMLVLIEGKSKLRTNLWEGYTDNYIKVLVESGLNLKNKLIRVHLDSINGVYILAYLEHL